MVEEVSRPSDFEDGEFLSMEYRRRHERNWQYECCVCGLRYEDQRGASSCCLPAITGEVEREDWSEKDKIMVDE